MIEICNLIWSNDFIASYDFLLNHNSNSIELSFSANINETPDNEYLLIYFWFYV